MVNAVPANLRGWGAVLGLCGLIGQACGCRPEATEARALRDDGLSRAPSAGAQESVGPAAPEQQAGQVGQDAKSQGSSEQGPGGCAPDQEEVCSDERLSLVLKGSTLVPSFDQEISHYSLSVPATQDELWLTLTMDVRTRARIGERVIESGVPFALPLVPGRNEVVLRVESGALDRVYTLVAERGKTRDGYLKASNASAEMGFGTAVAISGDARVIAVGAPREDGCDVEPQDSTAPFPSSTCLDVGAVYVFERQVSGSWRQSAYLKASDGTGIDYFGAAVALDHDGQTLVVGARLQSSCPDGHVPAYNGACSNLGSAYVFIRGEGQDGGWSEQTALKPAEVPPHDNFGKSLSISADGLTVAVGSNTAAHVFQREGEQWLRQDRLPSLSLDPEGRGQDGYADAIALSADGHVLAVGAPGDKVCATGMDSLPTETSSYDCDDQGAVYVYGAGAGAWMREAYIKLPQAWADAEFGASVALSDDGSLLWVGAPYDQGHGVVRSYTRQSHAWLRAAELVGPTVDRPLFGRSLAVDGGGLRLAVGAPGDLSGGAVHRYLLESGQWQLDEVQVADPGEPRDAFGAVVAVSADEGTLVVGARGEASCGYESGPQDNGCAQAGAVYVF